MTESLPSQPDSVTEGPLHLDEREKALSQSCWFGRPAEDCPCGRCALHYQVSAFYLEVETTGTVGRGDLQRRLEECLDEEGVMASYPTGEGVLLKLCGFYRPLRSGKRLYSVFATMAALCVQDRLVRSITGGLRDLQPDGAAPAQVDVAGFGPHGQVAQLFRLGFWMGQRQQMALPFHMPDDHVPFGSREDVLSNFREYRREIGELLDDETYALCRYQVTDVNDV
ncbi:hypothetical protein HIM_12650 [Hirsutella minnesotensis 3608]|uniref:Uncharacterized protein n=1 Tax=Hirsutella minnesotensis 3608 TaxID=1043627 RepID=A0A0F7ZET7_9HYPO|nr:hypothetical protein HIM_12650 [Hirsutella minnesotensis 3608]